MGRLNADVISIADKFLSIDEFNKSYMTGEHEVFTEDSIATFLADTNKLIKKGEVDALSHEEFESVEKATKEFETLISVKVLDASGQPKVMYVRRKV